MSQDNSTKKQVIFIQYAQPQLEDGNYQLTVQQTVSSKTDQIPATIYQDEKGYTVRGERYSLSPSDLVSVFPPNTSLGEFNNVLPHVILSRKTLPWERSVGGSSGVNDAPWLGLIVFDEGDIIPIPQEMTLLDLLPATEQTSSGEAGKLPAGTYFPEFPVKQGATWRQLDYGEYWTDNCQVIDLPAAQFNTVLPTLDDLGWLAHVREVQLVDKSEAYIKKVKATAPPMEPLDTAQLAEVVSNRFPLAGKKSVVHLVCLEDFGPVLPGADGSNKLPAGMETVRLVSLYNWSFTVVSEQFTFSGLLLAINKPGGIFAGNTLQIPFTASGQTTGDSAVANALNMGFAAFNHRTRMGDKTVSWYHGPFVPFNLQTTIAFPGNTTDDFLRYNPDSAMFDVAYSAAWQLGRLLGLQNSTFSTTLYNWKRGLAKSTILQIEQEFIDLDYAAITALIQESLGNYVNPLPEVNSDDQLTTATSRGIRRPTPAWAGQKRQAPLRKFLKQKIKEVPGVEYKKPVRPEPVRNRLETIRDIMTNPAKLNQLYTTNGDIDLPYDIANFLARLKMLYGVPFNYLVPDERMLPQESLRFFYMDTAWADALVEGAFSIGDSTTADAALNQAVSPTLHAQANTHARKIRKNFLGLAAVEDTPDTDTFNPTGFLLRSEVVSGWPGLEVLGYDNKGNVLDQLRIDHLGPGVLLCIFDGTVQSVQIKQQPEALHFGVDIDPDNPDPADFTKSFRYITAVGENEPGSEAPIASLPVKDYTRTALASVLEIDKLACDMENALKTSTAVHYDGAFTSAEFALEMVEGVQQVTFTFT